MVRSGPSLGAFSSSWNLTIASTASLTLTRGFMVLGGTSTEDAEPDDFVKALPRLGPLNYSCRSGRATHGHAGWHSVRDLI